MAKGNLKKPETTKGNKIKHNETGSKIIDYPVFCFRHLHPDYSFNNCNDDEKNRLLEKLQQLSKLSWNDIKLAPKHGTGSEKIDRKSIKPAIPQAITEDVEHFLSFRFCGMKPIVGYRNGNILHIVYIDNRFTVYDH